MEFSKIFPIIVVDYQNLIPMRKIYFILFSLIAASFSKAYSQTIQIDTAANWQQFIPTILGGACLEISNVSYNAGPYTAARFTDGGVIGLNDGIVITTGKVQGISNTPIHFLSEVNNLPGDPVLTQIAGWNTYDATSLEFDFTAPVSDTVNVRYVFASEEYPEFVGMSFNDIFGFFITDNDGNSQNIALVQGNIPVTINSINHIDNSEFYIETAPTDSFAFDGRTVVLTAKFYAEANQQYHLKITIADAGDAIFDSAIFLESFTLSSQPISGTASLAGELLEAGLVEVFGFNNDSTMANLVDAFSLSNDGSYVFNDLEAGAYILKVTPDANLYPDALPKYYNNAYLWQDATIISLPCQDYSVGLSLAPIFTGNSSVSGTVFFTNNVMRTTADFEQEGMAGVSVWLYSVSLNDFARHTLSNEEGFYQFAGLDAGIYRIFIDIPGLPQESYHEILITANETLNGFNYLAGLNKIVIQDQNTAINESSIANLTVFPNPYQNQLSIRSNYSGQATIRILDLQGRMVFSMANFSMMENEVFTIQTSAMEKGAYILQIQQGENIISKPLIKN
jgi:hypothetical protein